MARYLADTNLLLRLADTPSPHNVIAAEALARLFREGHQVFITGQNIIEFWAVATRPRESNGLGWTWQRTCAEVRGLEQRFPLLAESPKNSCCTLLCCALLSCAPDRFARLD